MRRAVLAVFLIGLLARMSIGGSEEIGRLVVDLGDAKKRAAAYQALLSKLDPRAVPILTSALPGYDVWSQYYGVVILEKYPPKIGNPALLRLAMEGPPHLRVTAGAALYRRGDRKVTLSIADALLSEMATPATRRILLTRLYAVNDPSVQAAMKSLLEKDAPESLIVLTLHVLNYQGCRSAAKSAEALVHDERLTVRGLAAAYAFRYGREEHAAVVAEAAEGIPAASWPYLYALLSPTTRRTPEIQNGLARRIRSEESGRIVLQAITLYRQSPHATCAAALKERLSDPDPVVVAAVFDALLVTPAGLPPERLEKLLAGKDRRLALLAAEALLRHDRRAALAVILGILGESDPALRAEAAGILGGVRVGSVVDPLLTALMDPEEAVRAGAYASLDEVLFALFPYRSLNLDLTGYAPKADEATRRTAAALIARWWEEHRAGDW